MCIVAVSFAFWFRFVLSLRTMCIIACFVRQIAEATPDLNVHNKCTSRQRTEFNLFIAISMNFAEIYVNQMVCSLPFSFPFFHFCLRTGHTSSTDNALIIDFWRIAFAVFVCHFDFRERTQRANKIVWCGPSSMVHERCWWCLCCRCCSAFFLSNQELACHTMHIEDRGNIDFFFRHNHEQIWCICKSWLRIN